MSKDDMVESDAASSPATSGHSPSNQQSQKTGSAKKKSGKASKPRLTAVQKNTNHKDAENKRRNAIRERFTELSHLVPEAEGQERSEQVMLAKTKTYLQESIEEMRRLEQMAVEQGIFLNEDEKLRDVDFGGKQWKSSFVDEYEAQKRKKGDNKADGDAEDGDDDG